MAKIRNVVMGIAKGFPLLPIYLFILLFALSDVTSTITTILLTIGFLLVTPFVILNPDHLMTVIFLLMVIIIVIFAFAQSKKAELTILKITDYCFLIVNTNDPKEVNLSFFGEFKIHISSAILKSFSLLNKINNKPFRNSMKLISILGIFFTVLIYLYALIYATALLVFFGLTNTSFSDIKIPK